MHLIIQDFWERRHAGVVLAASRDCLRVAFPDRDDVVALDCVNGQWILEGEGLVEIEALLIPGEESEPLWSLLPAAATAQFAATAAH